MIEMKSERQEVSRTINLLLFGLREIKTMILYLCIVLRTRQKRQLICSREMCPDLLHLTKTLPFPPLRPSVLEPHLQIEKCVNVIKTGRIVLSERMKDLYSHLPSLGPGSM